MIDNLKSKKVLSYDDVAAFSAGKNTESLVDVAKYDASITSEYIKLDMVPVTGNTIYVRDSVAQKLAKIEAKLKEKNYRLKIVYGYRHPDVQKKYFESRKIAVSKERPDLKGLDLDRFTHNFVAVPEIGGHPAGAAVDLTLIQADGSEIDMGSAIADYTDERKIPTYSDEITNDQMNHRALLHDLMISEGFAPFYGEWWHFSYGDREWAAFYNKTALYGAVDFKLN